MKAETEDESSALKSTSLRAPTEPEEKSCGIC